ncbi:hypothetical protein AYI69_g6529 [Smittium culicis]|uniref:Uncharacterized protein n=1 Tax=Smittium culicis TaxID=133412 RepID=A0A1R1XYR6_9FUNG|nr:hypothetical protein AYI69_g6529 [Smittium culicis]
MENGNMIPGSPETISLPTAITTGKNCNTRPKKRKITAIKQQELSSAIHLSHVVNYFAHLFTTRKFRVNTIKSYKSAILNLVAGPKTMENFHCMKEFLKAIEETDIKSIANPDINITPIIEKTHEWGENRKLEIMKLTTKCCWLLALCGFLRASDINRIDDPRTTIFNETLNIVIIAPKKRMGQ